MNTATEPGAAWHSFMAEPAHYIQAERLARCFGGAFPASLCERMLAAPRLTERLSGLIVSYYELPSATEDKSDATDRTVALASMENLTEIVKRAGAIFWSAAIVNTVLARDVNALQSSVGEGICSFAVKHRDLAGPEQPLAPFDTLAERITVDGWRCFAAWCDAIDWVMGARAKLKLPVEAGLDAPPAEPFTIIGPAIIRRAAAR